MPNRNADPVDADAGRQKHNTLTRVTSTGAVPDQRVTYHYPTTLSRRRPGVRRHARSQCSGREPLWFQHHLRVWLRASSDFSA